MDKATIKALQRVLNDKYGGNLVVDGVVGKRTRSALQVALRVPVTGKRDETTTRALQQYLGAEADGIWGHETTAKLQQALNDGWF